MKKLLLPLLFLPAFFPAEAAFPPYYFSADLAYHPREIPGGTVKKYILFDKAGPGVTRADDGPFTDSMRENIYNNRNVRAIRRTVKPLFGYTTGNVNMTMLPTGKTLHKGNKRFDANQYTKLSPSTPAAVLHKSADGKFYFVQSPEMRGWIPSDSIRIYDADYFFSAARLPFITVTKDGTKIGAAVYNTGDRIPVKSYDDRTGKFKILLPQGIIVSIKAGGSITPGSESFSEEKMKKLAESILGQPYDWGGKGGRRDCSAYVRDLWRVFGTDLPRNTSLQAEVGRELIKAPKSEEEFYKTLAGAKPFKTLIFFKGHVLMYGGREGKDFIVYHAVNRLTRDDGSTAYIAAVAKHRLFTDGFSKIWKRVVKVTELD